MVPLPPFRPFPISRAGMANRACAAALPRIAASALAIVLAASPLAAFAQTTNAAPGMAAPLPSAEEERIGFEADSIEYKDDSNEVAAIGNVVLTRADQSVRADRVTWNRETGQIVATGNIRFVDKDGNQLFTDQLELTDELKAGAMQNMLLALREGGRLAAQTGTREADGRIRLDRATYTGCEVEDSEGCPKTPTWRITAREVIYDPDRHIVRFNGARLELFGARLLPMPGLMVATDGRAISGLLIPDLRLSASNGVEISQAWYQRLGDNRDLTVTGYVYTEALPMVSAQYRQLDSMGAFQITGYATRSSRIAVSPTDSGEKTDWRGYVAANGRYQLSPHWSVTASGRYASDRTFLRRYDISRDDRLRSMVDLERIDSNSYLSIAGWATQTLRKGDEQGMVPIALPLIDYRRRLSDPVLGGRIELQANSLAITRTSGQDSRRAFASARWDMRRLTGAGQEITLTALARGDVYHSDENASTLTEIYRGESGWQTRAIATAAVDVKWPLVGQLWNGTQVLTPRVQVVATPKVRNLALPNEDARAIDLEDSNLFALNRFPGYDRIEDGVRVTYGLDWQFERPGWRVNSTIGQSVRMSRKPAILPEGTGLTDKVSDFVGRTEVRFRDFVKLTHRFRLDKDTLAVRRNEFDATIGDQRTYAEIGYLRLNRDNTSGLEDMQDREELRVAGRVAFARYWSLFGSGVFNLTNREEDPSFTSDGFQALRTRLGVAYRDDCLEVAFTWRRDYIATGDAEKGNTFQVHVGLRNLGFR